MQIKDSIITFWFRKQPNPKIYVDKLNAILSEHFFEFNTIGVPANIDPIIPRLTAVSSSNHSNIEISLINARLMTRFDENYCENIELCIEYLKKRALKVFEALSTCGINIVYSAIFINLEEQEENATKKIKEHFLKDNDMAKIDEIGVRLSQAINDKFYCNVSFNNSKQIKVEKVFVENNQEIILPLISLNEASKVENYLSVSLEINDKLAFNNDARYVTNEKDLLELFDLSKNQLFNEMKRFK